MSVTAVAAAGEQFIPILGFREGTLRALGIPQADGLIAYWTLLNERDGGIHGVHVIWEECETAYDIDRGVECYERLKAQGPTGATVVHPLSTRLTYARRRVSPRHALPVWVWAGGDGFWRRFSCLTPACGRRWGNVRSAVGATSSRATGCRRHRSAPRLISSTT